MKQKGYCRQCKHYWETRLRYCYPMGRPALRIEDDYCDEHDVLLRNPATKVCPKGSEPATEDDRARQRRWNDKAREGYEIGMKAWSETSKFGI